MTSSSEWVPAPGGLGTAAVAERAWSIAVPHQARGCMVARHLLAGELRDAIGPELLADAVAIVAELVGNAIRHANPLPGDVIRVAWRLRARAGRDHLHLRVTDGGGDPRQPRPRPVNLDAVDGRGLAIVASLAEAWGVDTDGLGQSVWAELSYPHGHRDREETGH
jgi:anti-sigma regulatory factor (Ser/Thr protein kinase)